MDGCIYHYYGIVDLHDLKCTLSISTSIWTQNIHDMMCLFNDTYTTELRGQNLILSYDIYTHNAHILNTV